jgi:hypothetical protein
MRSHRSDRRRKSQDQSCDWVCPACEEGKHQACYIIKAGTHPGVFCACRFPNWSYEAETEEEREVKRKLEEIRKIILANVHSDHSTIQNFRLEDLDEVVRKTFKRMQ